MSMITIQCRLSADEQTRYYLWRICQQHALLLGELIEQVPSCDKFSDWQQKGSVPREALELLSKAIEFKQLVEKFLKILAWKSIQLTSDQVSKCYFWYSLQKTFQDLEMLPGRFVTSAIVTVQYMYKSWFALQKRRFNKKKGKECYLKVQEQDFELATTTDLAQEQICSKAQEILEQVIAQSPPNQTRKSSPKKVPKKGEKNRNILEESHTRRDRLFKLYEETDDSLTQRAIAHLLRNNLEVKEETENLDYLSLRLEKKRIEIAHLEEQLRSRLPKRRDPARKIVLSALEEALCLPDPSNSLRLLILSQIFAVAQVVTEPSLQFNAHLLRLLQHPCLSEETCIAEFVTWQTGEPERLANLMTLPKSLPYSIQFGSSDDLYWSLEPKNQSQAQLIDLVSQQTEQPSTSSPKRKRRKRRKIQHQESICVRFKGLSDYTFTVQCSHRHLPIFCQCLQEWQLHRSLPDEDKFAFGLFPLCSARLIWRKDKQELYKKPPKSLKENSFQAGDQSKETGSEEWKQYRLFLHCTIDTRALTAEGTEQIRQEKINEAQNIQKGFKSKTKAKNRQKEAAELTKQQRREKAKNRESASSRNQSTLARLPNPSPPRPSKAPYVGQPHIVVGVCFSRSDRASVAVFDVREQKVIQFMGVRGLLADHSAEEHHRRFWSNPERKGKRGVVQMKFEQYHLVNRFWQQQQENLQRQSEEQKQDLYAEDNSESQLGQYLDRLLAARIAQLAIKWQASSIVIPELADIRESIECEIQAWAQRKFPNKKELQKQYAKEFRTSFHRWSYGRLARSIRNRAARDGIAIELGMQPRRGTLQEKVVAVVKSAYEMRQA